MRAPRSAKFREQISNLRQLCFFAPEKLDLSFNQRVRVLYFFSLLGAFRLGRGDIFLNARLTPSIPPRVAVELDSILMRADFALQTL